MQTVDKRSWPVLFVSDQVQASSDEGEWIRGIIRELVDEDGFQAVTCSAYGDAHDLIYAREDFGAIVVDWEMRSFGRRHGKNESLSGEDSSARLVEYARTRNRSVPILLISDRGSIEAIPNGTLERVSGVIWKLTDTPDFNAGRIERAVAEYASRALPPFFGALVDYVREYNFAWHTPGHMGGQGFLKSPSGTAFHKFFGENVLRADLSISVPELGSLLDHSGVVGEAERFSARTFGADDTFYALNGTSTGNQVVWRSVVSPGERCLLDRNCHKSLNHAMIVSGARPEYLRTLRNALGIIGPADWRSIDNGADYAMAALTNSTYDGICYDVARAAARLGRCAALHFDEAWFAYARFHPLYRGRYAMSLPSRDRLVFSTQSTHKLLTAFSQASMIHVRYPEPIASSAEARRDFRDLFNESYMMHGSTSPQYAMVASLEVATKMMKDNGEVAFGDIIEEAIELRRKVARIRHEELGDGEWFFDVWQGDEVVKRPVRELASDPKAWVIKPGDRWHGFPSEGLDGDAAMLDPIKLTFLCPGLSVDGVWSERGIPAAVVTRYLGDRGIVCEKTDYYSWLLLNSLGTTKGKQGTLIAELFRFRDLYERNVPMSEVFPGLVAASGGRYSGEGLRDHCQSMHERLRSARMIELMVAASSSVPSMAVTPAEAYRAIVKRDVEFVALDALGAKERRICAIMVVPYPPGIPLVMGGELLDEKASPTIDYLKAREAFERDFPGYESDLHGVRRVERGGRTAFEMLVLK
jgi:lysine decarboxylase/arginine decarboxylase